VLAGSLGILDPRNYKRETNVWRETYTRKEGPMYLVTLYPER